MRVAGLVWGLLLAYAFPAAAQDTSQWLVRCGGPFQTCGYIDSASGETRLAFAYDRATPFAEGLAAVRVDGLWGYIDPSGALVIPPAYVEAQPFYNGLAEVRDGEAAGVIDRSGRIVVEPQFERIIPLTRDVFVAAPINPAVHLHNATDADTLTGFGPAGLYHRRHGWITPPDYRFTSFHRSSRGLIWAGQGRSAYETVWGLMAPDGSWRVSPRYGHVQRLVDGRAIVRTVPNPELQARDRYASILSGAVDENGELVVPLQYPWLSYWRAGHAIATLSGSAAGGGTPDQGPNEGLVARDGSLHGGRYFDEVEIPEDGSLPRVRDGETWYSIDAEGALLPDQRDGTLRFRCPDGIAFLYRGDQIEAVRPDGAPIGVFEDRHVTAQQCSGPFGLQRDGRWVFLMPDGSILGEPEGFEQVFDFIGDTAAVQRGDRWGVIGRDGGFLIEPAFEDMAPLSSNLFRVRSGDVVSWIDASGREAQDPASIRPDPETALTCAGDLQLFRGEEGWGMRNASGEVVIQPDFRVLTCFRDGSAWAVTAEASEWCRIGPDGLRVAALPCEQSHFPVWMSHASPEQLHDDPFESSVLWSLAYFDYLSGVRPDPPRLFSHRSGMITPVPIIVGP